jgi:hypothetical protein
MKATFKSSVLLLIASATILASCVKEETRAVLNPPPGGASVLNTSISTIVLQQANQTSNAGNFTWTPTDFGFKGAVNYTLQLSKGGTNFAQATTTEINMGSALSKSFTVGEFNGKLLDIIPYGSAQAIQARIKADVGNGVDPIYSNVVSTITATAYRDVVVYNFPQALWVAGNYLGWDPGSAPKLVDKTASGTTGANYEGYINFNNASPEFKFVKGNNWGAGDFGSAGAGLLGNGGPNLSLSNGAGVYLIKANTTNMTWSSTKITTWGIIGDATPAGWGASTPMTFNPSDGSWSITVNLVGNKFMKFRANNDWTINLGDNAPRDNKPDYGGSDIPIALDGNYTIILELGTAGNYSYTIRKN